jgi:hypothetical protein
MSYANISNTTFADGPQLDAFKRLRVSTPFPVADFKNIYDMNPFLLDNILVAGATATFLGNEAAIQLGTTTASGDKVTRRSRDWIKYYPGKSQLVKVTGLFGTPAANLVRRMGLFDDFNGIFFEQTSAGLAVVRRTFTSGSVVNNSVARAAWNLDTLDGTGNAGNPSGVLLDETKTQVFIMDYEWLGIGRIRWGVDVGTRIIYVHEFTGGNDLTVVTFSTPDLPITWEMENTGLTATPNTMKAICASVDSEGAQDPAGYKFSRSNVLTHNATIGTLLPLITIRPKATFAGKTNRVSVWPTEWWAANASAAGNVAVFVILRNATLTGTPSWVSHDANSAVEYDVSATGVSGGTSTDSNGLNGQNSLPAMTIEMKYPLTLSADGTTQDTLTIAAIGVVGATNTVMCGIDWKEWR